MPAGHDGLPDRFPRSGKKQILCLLRALAVQSLNLLKKPLCKTLQTTISHPPPKKKSSTSKPLTPTHPKKTKSIFSTYGGSSGAANGLSWASRFFAHSSLYTYPYTSCPLPINPMSFCSPWKLKTISMSRLSGLIGNLPLPISLPGGGNKSENIVAFLKSRNLKTRLITKYDLLPRLYKDIWDEDNKKWNVEREEDKPTVVLAIQKDILNDVFMVRSGQ